LGCHPFPANAFRLFLHGAAFNLVNFFRQRLSRPWRSAQIETLRAQLFKIGVRVRRAARCIRFHLATGWPFQQLFHSATLVSDTSQLDSALPTHYPTSHPATSFPAQPCCPFPPGLHRSHAHLGSGELSRLVLGFSNGNSAGG
jgi:Transposase DDE domain group 1